MDAILAVAGAFRGVWEALRGVGYGPWSLLGVLLGVFVLEWVTDYLVDLFTGGGGGD